MNVLIVDDQEKILEATQKLVNWEKLQVNMVFTADSAQVAKKILCGNSIDIMLTDIEMPGESGIELQQWQKINYPQICSIFLTSHAEFEYAKKAIHGGAFDYIVQPAGISEIEETIERCIMHIREKNSYMKKSNQYDVLTQHIPYPEERKPDSTKWGKWLIQGDCSLLRNQAANLLELAAQEEYLTIPYRQKMIHTFLEACSIAGYEKKIDLAQFFSEENAYERMLQAYNTNEELLGEIDKNLYKWKKVIIQKEGRKESEYTVQERIQEVLKYLDENMDRMVSRREAANYVYLNEDYFSRMFKKEIGMGFKEYLLKTKMEYAARLLENTIMPVTLVASKVGYENFTNFSQMFRKVMGVTPTEYRKSASIK